MHEECLYFLCLHVNMLHVNKYWVFWGGRKLKTDFPFKEVRSQNSKWVLLQRE